MTVKGINLKSLAFAGFVAGYVMYFADKHLAGTVGLFGSYPGTASPWWMLQHHIDAIVFAIPFAMPAIQRRLPGSGWLKGTVYGLLWAVLVTVIMLVIGAFGANLFAHMRLTSAGMATSVLLHLVYGFTLGALYNPPRALRRVEEPISRFEESEQAVPVHHEQWRPSRHTGSRRRKQWHSR